MNGDIIGLNYIFLHYIYCCNEGDNYYIIFCFDFCHN